MSTMVKKIEEKEIRCKRCKRLLMKGEIKTIEIKCPKCGYLQVISTKGGDSKN